MTKEIMAELRIIKKDGKETLKELTKNSIAIASIKGCIQTQDVKIDHNVLGIKENKAEIGKLRTSITNMLVRVAGIGGGLGALAGWLASLIGG